MDYVTFKMTLRFINSYPDFIKCTIDNGVLTCNEEIRKHFKDLKDFSKIKHLSFYVLSGDSEMFKVLSNVPFELLPVYKLTDSFDVFLKKYIKYITLNTHCYNTKKYDVTDENGNDIRESFHDKEKCLSIKSKQTNPEFKNFKQLIFHAGNHYQIFKHGLLLCQSIFNFTEKRDEKICYGIESVNNCMLYLFEYLKKGILVGIKNNKLAIFLPFSNANYINDFYTELYFNESDKEKLKKLSKEPNNQKLLRELEHTTKEYFKKFRMTFKDATWDRRKWYANGCFFRHDTYEGDKLVLVYQDILTELCENRKINDCIFLLNVRDFPLLRKDRKHPYTYIIDKKIPNKYLKDFCPILSACTSIYYDDYPMITQDDWYKVEQKFYPDGCNNIYKTELNVVKWEDKINVVFFRGAASGCGIDEKSNMRLKLIEFSKNYPELFNVGLTSFNRRMKKSLNKPLSTVDVSKYERAEFVNDNEKIKHKYIINVDGHVTAFRLGNELGLGSLLLIVQSHYYIWISTFIKPYDHYIPIKCDLSDLIEKIEWCKNNDDKCKEIVENAKKINKKLLCKEGIMDYMQNLLNKFALTKDPLRFIKNYKKANKIGIVLCYRNDANNSRYNEMLFYTYTMSKIFLNLEINFRFIISEQSQNDKFNIGTLKNVGFMYLMEKEPDIDHLIFSDIDMIPDYDLLPYFYTCINGMAMFALNGTRYMVDNNGVFMGGCIGCNPETFLKINGYSNAFTRGWGGEDENLYIRTALEKVDLYRPKGSIVDLEVDEKGSRKYIMDKLRIEKKSNNYDNLKFEQLCKYEQYKEDGLNNMTHKIMYENFNNNVYHIISDLDHKHHETVYPSHFDFSDFDMKKYEKYKKFKSGLKPNIIDY